jgi:hypothetical protein
VARCLYDDTSETLFAYGYDRLGRWHLLAALAGWTGPLSAPTLSGGSESLQLVTSGISGLADGRYVQDGPCTVLDLSLAYPPGWGLSLSFDCQLDGPGGRHQAYATIACTGFHLE